MRETKFTETEALLLAMRDDSDEGTVELEDYLIDNLWPSELHGLEEACEHLLEAIQTVRVRVKRKYDREHPGIHDDT